MCPAHSAHIYGASKQPLWAAQPAFRNRGQSTAYTASDGALATALFQSHVGQRITDFYQGARLTLWRQAYSNDLYFFDDLQRVRGVVATIDPVDFDVRPQVRASFKSLVGLPMEAASARLVYYWRIMMKERHAHNMNVDLECENVRQAAAEGFNELIARFNDFAQANNIPLRPAVLDWFMQGHSNRYNRGNMPAIGRFWNYFRW